MGFGISLVAAVDNVDAVGGHVRLEHGGDNDSVVALVNVDDEMIFESVSGFFVLLNWLLDLLFDEWLLFFALLGGFSRSLAVELVEPFLGEGGAFFIVLERVRFLLALALLFSFCTEGFGILIVRLDSAKIVGVTSKSFVGIEVGHSSWSSVLSGESKSDRFPNSASNILAAWRSSSLWLLSIRTCV